MYLRAKRSNAIMAFFILTLLLWPTLCSNDYKYRRICLRGRGRVSKKMQDMQVMRSCANFPPSSPPNPIFGHIIRSVLKNSIQKRFHSEEIPKREDVRRKRRCSTGHVHTVQLSHPPPPSRPPIFGQHHVLEGQLQSSSTIPNSCPWP